MEAKEYINTSQKDVYEKKHNILVPICLGNKFFTKNNEVTDNIRKYVEWALENTKEKVLILVVDKIQDTNYFVRHQDSRSELASRRRVLKDGQEIKSNIIDMLAQSFSKEEREKVTVIHYEEYEKSDPNCHEITHKVYKEFKNNKDFSEKVLGSVKSSIKDREFSEEDYWRLCDYVLDEFALVYAGVEYKSDYYGLYVYPETDSVVYFIESIQVGKAFSGLNNKLPERKIGLVILNES